MEQAFQVSSSLRAFWILHALLDEIVPLTEGESASYLFDDEEKMKRYFLNWLFHFIDLFTALYQSCYLGADLRVVHGGKSEEEKRSFAIG